MKTRTIIVSAPSGAGKSSFVEKLCREDSRIRDVITYTTRQPRRGEGPGNPYHFISVKDFERLIREDFFVEWAKVHNNYYGTPWDQIRSAWSEGIRVIMDLDIQGADTFRKKLPDGLKTIFILPPSIEELKKRIIRRDGKEPSDLEIRLANAKKEMEQAHLFDVQIVNDDFEHSYSEFKKIIDSWLSGD
jgi:guanylate kinase